MIKDPLYRIKQSDHLSKYGIAPMYAIQIQKHWWFFKWWGIVEYWAKKESAEEALRWYQINSNTRP